MSINKILKLSFCLIALNGTPQLLKAQSYVPEWNDKRMKVAPVVPLKAYSFNLSDVKLLPSPFKTAMDADVAYLLTIEPDRLLSAFRTHSGLKAKGKMYDGWESSGLAGHTLGHYLSAVAMHYASTGDKEFLRRANYIVTELDECQFARKTGYIGAIPKEDTIWAEVSKGDIRSHGFDLNGGWSPWYTVHKVMAGLLDAYLYCNNKQALAICEKMANWTGETVKYLDDKKLQEMLLCEYGGMAETLTNLYAINGNKKYLELSYKFYDKKILDPLAAGKDILPGKHSNTQIPKIIASARRYEVTNDKKDKAIADFFWETVVNHHSYATGGNSNYEYLTDPDKLNDKLTDNTTETCNTYNMLKLTRHLFAVAPTARLMDFYERGLYNHILASQNHSNGMMCYFVPLRMGGNKHFSTPFNDFTCCVGSGMENHVKYNESIYFRGVDGSLYVNLFIPSLLQWQAKGFILTQQSSFPNAGQSIFTINTKRPVVMAIRIRKPKWATSISIAVNGISQKTTLDNQGYLVLNRTWRNNDKITFIATENLYTEAMPDNANRRAIFYGPVLLAGNLGAKEPDPLEGIPVFVTTDTDPNQWLQMVDKNQLTFHSINTSQPKEVSLMPFNQTQDQFYSVYWDVFTPQAWAVQQKAYEEQKKQQMELEAHTMDMLRLGEMQPERDHNFTGENATTGEEHQRKWRSADNGGYLQYDMKVDANTQNTLINSYWGMDNRGRTFDILIDGIKLATEDLNQYKQSRFYDISYVIPIELTKGKRKVTVKLVAKKDNSAGPVYGSRLVKN